MPKADHPFTDASRGVRLQKFLADAGVASRRRCEEMIAEGLVEVNGTVVASLPAWIDPVKDEIVADGRRVRRDSRVAYVLLFKPKGVVCTNSDPEGRSCAVDLVDHPSGLRLYPVGRLDMDSSGLLLMTNDGELANRLTHPRYEMHKGYEVTVAGQLADDDIKRLERGVFLSDGERGPGRKAKAGRLDVIARDRQKTILYMELFEGRNRQIRRMLLALGHPVKKLRRVKMGPLRLKGLAVGEWRDLTTDELDQVRREAFADAATIHRRRERAERNEGGAPVRKRRGIHASRRNEKSDRLERRAQRTRDLSAKARAERGVRGDEGASRTPARGADRASRPGARGSDGPPRAGARGAGASRGAGKTGRGPSRGASPAGTPARPSPKGKPRRSRRDDASLDHRPRLS
ncbi:MAG: pseudouridine synthase [Phycisphaerales bacterium]|jgi:23S rRNA pseudouridine2605 synthase